MHMFVGDVCLMCVYRGNEGKHQQENAHDCNNGFLVSETSKIIKNVGSETETAATPARLPAAGRKGRPGKEGPDAEGYSQLRGAIAALPQAAGSGGTRAVDMYDDDQEDL